MSSIGNREKSYRFYGNTVVLRALTIGMGCGTSKSVQTVENETNSVTNGAVVKDSVKEVIGSTNGSTTAAGARRMSRPMTPVPKPVAFDIPLDVVPTKETNGSTDGTDSNVPKKLPPRRLLALAEQPVPQLTAKQLTEKQSKAEEKRLEILGERKLKAQKYNEKFLPSNNSSSNSANNSSSNLNNAETNSNNSQESNNDKIQNEEKVTGINSNNANVVVNGKPSHRP